GKVGKVSHQVVPALVNALQDNDVRVRCEAAESLSKCGSKATEAIPALLRAAKEQSAAVRFGAVSALYDIGLRTDEVVPVLIEMLTDKEFSMRRYAADKLGELGPKAKPAIPALKDAVKTPQLQRIASEALTKIDVAAAAKAGVFTILVDDVGRYLKDPNAPRRKGPISFHSHGWVEDEQKQRWVELRELMSFNGMTMGYILRAKLDPSKITKATIEVKDLDEVEIRYTDDWLAMDGLNEKDIEGL